MSREEITIQQEGHAKRVVLCVDGEEASECWIIPLTIRVGVATVRIDGIGGVATKPEHRLKGYASRVLRRAVEEMSAGDAALSMLYGIPDFYHRFGYVTAGPEYALFLYEVQREQSLPPGWQVRQFAPQDFREVRRLYEQATALATGAVVRGEDSATWQQLQKTPGSYPQDECWVTVSPAGAVEGYAWRARWCWSIRDVLEHEFPDALPFGEVVAGTPGAADTLLTFCSRRASEEGKEEALISVPPDSMVALGARYRNARQVQLYSANGGSMVRTLNVQRLLQSLLPELNRQVSQARQPVPPFCLTFRTELGEGTLCLNAKGGTLAENCSPGSQTNCFTVELSQAVLARLALGFAPAEDLCARLPSPLPEQVVSLLSLLFPARYQHAYLPDRY